jgi:MOSC domain-containing protein
MPHLARLNVTPVKSLGLRHPASADLTEAGIPGNRRFHLVDAAGRLFTGADHGPLVRLLASFDPDTSTLSIVFPDGTSVVAAADRLGPAHATDFWGRPVAGRFVEGPLAEALGAWVGQPLRLVRADVEGDGSDVERLSLVALASVRDLGFRDGRPDLDPRRFRMNLEIDGCEAFEEDTWSGQRVRIGTAVIRVLGPVPRCVVTTQDPATGNPDFDTLKRIAAYRPLMRHPRGVPFGMYATVEEPGRVSVGDAVEPLGQ